ncbi:MAG: TonB family protein [Steroidobacter sp.]
MALTASAEAQQGTKRTVIMILVIGLHLVAFWALQNGLARRLVEVLPNDIKTKIIEEKKEEPPPPPPPPPDVQAPPPPFVPPVEVAIATPMETPPTAITTTTEKPPVSAPIMQPRQPVVVSARVDLKRSRGSCDELYTSALQRENAEGIVVIECAIDKEGRCRDPRVADSSGNGEIDKLGQKCARDLLRFIPGSVDGVVGPTNLKFRLNFKPK